MDFHGWVILPHQALVGAADLIVLMALSEVNEHLPSQTAVQCQPKWPKLSPHVSQLIMAG